MRKWAPFAFFSTVAFAVLSGSAMAHTASPFLLPEQFDTKSDTLSFQSAITVEKFFVASNNFKTSYQVTSPDGKNSPLEAAASLKKFNVAEVATPLDGTYRIRTENSVGNKTKYALVDGRWLRVRQPRPQNAMSPAPAQPQGDKPNDAKAGDAKAVDNKTGATPAANQPPRFITEDKVPANAKIMESDNTPIAETYVSKGKPTPVPVVSNKGLELKLLSHPNELYVGESLKAQVLMDGKPVPNLEVEVFKGASSFERNAKREQPHVTTNAQGQIDVKFAQSGIYLITTAYPAPNADNTQPPATQTYTYGLTVEVAE